MAMSPGMPGFSNGILSVVPVTGFKTGQIAGSATFKRCPSHPCSAVKFKACATNTGGVFIGNSDAVAVESGTNDNFKTGWELEPKEQTEWMGCRDLNEFYIICDNATDDLIVMLIP